MPYDVFISYGHQDKLVADAACARLEARDIRCWIAPRDLLAGQSYAEGIGTALRNCRALVLVFSSSANISRHVNNEVERAVNHNIPVIPLRIENVNPTGALEYFIGSVHWLDALTEPMEHHLERLADQVQKLIGTEGKPLSPPPPAASSLSSARPSSSKLPLYAGLGLLVVAVCGFFLFKFTGSPNTLDAVVTSTPIPTKTDVRPTPAPISHAAVTPTPVPTKTDVRPTPTAISPPPKIGGKDSAAPSATPAAPASSTQAASKPAGDTPDLMVVDLGFQVVYYQLRPSDSIEQDRIRALARKLSITPHTRESGADALVAFYLPQVGKIGKDSFFRLGSYLAAGQGYANAIQEASAATERQTLVTKYQNEYKPLIELNLVQAGLENSPLAVPDLAGPATGVNLATSYSLFVEKVRSAIRSSGQ